MRWRKRIRGAEALPARARLCDYPLGEIPKEVKKLITFETQDGCQEIYVSGVKVEISMPFRSYWKEYSSPKSARAAARRLAAKLSANLSKQGEIVKRWHNA